MSIKRFLLIISMIFLMLLFLVASSCSLLNDDCSVLHLSPEMCKYSLDGVSPEVFCTTNGDCTWLKGKYLSAKLDDDGCLIIVLKDEVLTEWKNTFMDLQVLQCVLADSCDIGIEIDYSKDFMFLMRDAHTCGFEISEDFTQIIASPEDNSWYFPLITMACAKKQFFDGKICSEVVVEFLKVDINGEIVERTIYPDDIVTFTDRAE